MMFPTHRLDIGTKRSFLRNPEFRFSYTQVFLETVSASACGIVIVSYDYDEPLDTWKFITVYLKQNARNSFKMECRNSFI